MLTNTLWECRCTVGVRLPVSNYGWTKSSPIVESGKPPRWKARHPHWEARHLHHSGWRGLRSRFGKCSRHAGRRSPFKPFEHCCRILGCFEQARQFGGAGFYGFCAEREIFEYRCSSGVLRLANQVLDGVAKSVVYFAEGKSPSQEVHVWLLQAVFVQVTFKFPEAGRTAFRDLKSMGRTPDFRCPHTLGMKCIAQLQLSGRHC